MTDRRDATKSQARTLAKRGLSVREIAAKTLTSKSTIRRWTAGVLPTTPAPPEVSASPGCGATDLGTVDGLSAEQDRLYAALETEGFDRSLALRMSLVSKRLTAIQESGCEDHWTLEDVRRLCASLNDIWLRQLEIATRDMTQVGQTNATRILDKAIEKVRVEAETLT